MIPTAEQLDELFRAGAMERLGMGSRRACYAIPGTSLCVKCYRSEEEIALGKYAGTVSFVPLRPSVVREIRHNRFSDRGNTSCQEWRYYQTLKAHLPPALMAAFPAPLDRLIVPSRGWCIVEDIVANADGTPVQAFHSALAAAPKDDRSRLLEQLETLEKGLIRYAVHFYDPPNILVQRCADGGTRLRITDFEPVSHTFVPLDSLSPIFVRLKLHHRFAHYHAMFGITLG